MNYKLEYITRLFQKTSNKPIENYCLARLWHKLDNDNIKIVPQQYVNRHTDKYALTDVYFPQIKIHIEVNEPAHYNSQERIDADEQRKREIENQTGHKVYVIDCRGNLSEIHREIDDIVLTIKNLIANDSFKPWRPDIERNPLYWKEKKKISLTDEISFNNIEDICKLFDADFNKTKRGFLRRGGILHPKNNGILLWWPSEKTRQGWINKLSDDEQEIIETHEDMLTREKHFNEHLNTAQLRIVFFYHRDILGLTSYKFKGLFAYDKDKSKPEIGTVWRRFDDKINIDLID